MAQQYQVQIVNGPSREDMMHSLTYGSSVEHNRIAVKFWTGTDRIKVCREVYIEGMSREDGSGNNWNFEGYLKKPDGSSSESVKGFYNTQRRSGNIRFNPD